jgi:hypothetical protein
MTSARHGHVVMHFADGGTIDAWTGLSLRDTFTDPLGELDFEAVPPRGQYPDYRKRLAKGELVTVLINNVNQGSYLVQERESDLSRDGGAVIRVKCHTPLITPYEGDVDPDLSLHQQTDVPVLDAILKALGPYGFNAVVGDSAANVAALSGKPLGGGAPNLNVAALKHQDSVAHEGETAYAYLARIITRLGVALRVDAEGTLLISAPNYTQPISDTLIQAVSSGRAGDYFVGPVTVHDSNAGQFSECVVRGQRADTGDPATARPVARVTEAELHPGRPSYTSFAAAYKPKIFKDKNARDRARALSVAKLELGLRAAQAFWVSGEVDGFLSSSGRIWQTDTLVHTFVELEELDEPMWVLERLLRQDDKGGQRTRLKLLPKGALVLGDVPH